MTGKAEKLNGGGSDAYDFSQDSQIKYALLARIKREYFGKRSKVKRLADDELEFVNAAEKPKPDDKKDKKPPTV